MSDELSGDAIIGLERLLEGATHMNWDYVARWLEGAIAIVKSGDATIERKIEAINGVCSGLCRGEWDRNLVGLGRVPHESLDEIEQTLKFYRKDLMLNLSKAENERDD